MTTPTIARLGRLKVRIRKWIKRNQPQSQRQSSASLPLPGAQSPTTGSVFNLGQNPSTHTLPGSNPSVVAPQATSSQTQTAPLSGPSTNAGQASVPGPSTGPGTNTTKIRWSSLQRFSSVLAPISTSFGPLKSIVSELIECVNIYETAAKDREDYKALQKELEQLFTELQGQVVDVTTPTAGGPMDPKIENLCKCIQDELQEVKAKQGNSSLKQYLQTGNAQDEVLSRYRRVHGHLIRLSLYMSASVKKDVEKRAKDLQKQVESTHSARVSACLDKLRPSLSACYNSTQAAELKRGECTPGTRMEVLARMHNHASDPGSGAVFWLSGMAGTGKTTIAFTLCSELHSKGQLAASFFCSRLLPECRNINSLIPSIAYQLARHSQHFRSALFKVLEADPDIPTRSLHIQFEDLIKGPLLTTQRDNTLSTNFVIVIDGPDEFENKDSTRIMLDILLTNSLDLPIKFFVSSRPEPEIRDEMMKQLDAYEGSRLVLHELDKSIVQADIERYLRVALHQMDLSDTEFDTLARDAGVLFIYAATVVRYISYSNFNQNPRGRLQTVLNASGPGVKQKNKAIDALYAAILREALENDELDEAEQNDILQVIHTIVFAQEPLTIGILSGLLQFGSIDRARAAIRPLWSVLHISEASELVNTLHASFPEFVCNETRSGRYHCHPNLYHHRISQLCFDVIQTAPPFNICGLKSSFVRDKNVKDLDTRVTKRISPELFYASRYWAAHVVLADRSTELCAMVYGFLSTRLLLWLEVMNLKKALQIAVDITKQIDNWGKAYHELTKLANDARCFTATFSSTPISQSTPHLYLSMLPFWPQSRPISQIYFKNFTGLPKAEGTALNQRQLALLATWSFGNIQESNSKSFDSVRSAAFSPEGRRIVFAMHNQILVVDALNGQHRSRPLKGHIHPVLSVEYSPDGAHIISCSASVVQVQDSTNGNQISRTNLGGTRAASSLQLSPDGTRVVTAEMWSIYVWDACNGEKVLGPLKGHTNKINIVKYSPDGRQIVSGARDQTLRLWDAQTGETTTIIGPFTESNHSISSVGYSPDGTRIVFGSTDAVIAVWCTMKKEMVLGPIKGHTETIASVTYSPDGTYMASGSEDKTICVWDSQTGEMLIGPLDGHTGGILSVSYSPDSSQIVSSSYDKTIRIWDASIQDLVLSHFECHTGAITALEYSHDGTLVYSGSKDKTIIVWDTVHGNLILGPLKGHTDCVESISLSPEGTYIASGSRDKTLCIWDTRSGVMILGPLEGHTRPITSVHYSPDGKFIASSSEDGTVRVWDVKNGSTILGPLDYEDTNKLNEIVSVRYSHNGAHLAGAFSSNFNSINKTGVQIWDAKTGNKVLFFRYGTRITTLEYSLDDAYFIFGSTDSTLRVCSSQSGEILFQMRLCAPGAKDFRSYSLNSLKYSSTGSHIISGSSDKKINLWNAQSGNMLGGPLVGHIDQVNSVSYSPDDTFVASGSSDETIRIWRVRDFPAPHSAQSSYCVNWELNSDGWVSDSKNRSRALLWIPFDMHRSLIRSPANILIISRNEYIQLDFNGTHMGEGWAKCYRPVVAF